MYDRSQRIKNLSIAYQAASQVAGVSNYSLVSDIETILNEEIRQFKEEQQEPNIPAPTTPSTQDDEIPF